MTLMIIVIHQWWTRRLILFLIDYSLTVSLSFVLTAIFQLNLG